MLKPAKSLLKASSAAITSGDIVMTRKLKKALRRGPATAGAVQESNTFRIAYNRQEGKQKMKNDDLKKYIKIKEIYSRNHVHACAGSTKPWISVL